MFPYVIPIKAFGQGLHEGGYLGWEAAEVAKRGIFKIPYSYGMVELFSKYEFDVFVNWAFLYY